MQILVMTRYESLADGSKAFSLGANMAELTDKKQVLVIDDEDDLRDLTVDEIAALGFIVKGAGNIIAAREILVSGGIDLIVTDLHMPGGSGLELISSLPTINTKLPHVIVLSGMTDPETRAKVIAAGGAALIEKPCLDNRLLDLINKLLLSA